MGKGVMLQAQVVIAEVLEAVPTVELGPVGLQDCLHTSRELIRSRTTTKHVRNQLQVILDRQVLSKDQIDKPRSVRTYLNTDKKYRYISTGICQR